MTRFNADTRRAHDIAVRHTEAAAFVADILVVDRDSMDALQEAEEARRLAAQALEQGESGFNVDWGA